jgi:hypothetical protein
MYRRLDYVDMIKIAENLISRNCQGEKGKDGHVKHGYDVVCGDETEHLWLYLAFDVKSP